MLSKCIKQKVNFLHLINCNTHLLMVEKIFAKTLMLIKSRRGGGGVAIAQWIHMRLPSCLPRVESTDHTIYAFIILY